MEDKACPPDCMNLAILALFTRRASELAATYFRLGAGEPPCTYPRKRRTKASPRTDKSSELTQSSRFLARSVARWTLRTQNMTTTLSLNVAAGAGTQKPKTRKRPHPRSLEISHTRSHICTSLERTQTELIADARSQQSPRGVERTNVRPKRAQRAPSWPWEPRLHFPERRFRSCSATTISLLLPSTRLPAALRARQR
ncbi:hypothetical protein FKP32DRAFT_1182838 [Trametes sanguinea]|nr:hypothetical protein FKP32DRAFT_1182838 [Trametes sanguinea]